MALIFTGEAIKQLKAVGARVYVEDSELIADYHVDSQFMMRRYLPYFDSLGLLVDAGALRKACAEFRSKQ